MTICVEYTQIEEDEIEILRFINAPHFHCDIDVDGIHLFSICFFLMTEKGWRVREKYKHTYILSHIVFVCVWVYAWFICVEVFIFFLPRMFSPCIACKIYCQWIDLIQWFERFTMYEMLFVESWKENELTAQQHIFSWKLNDEQHISAAIKTKIHRIRIYIYSLLKSWRIVNC